MELRPWRSKGEWKPRLFLLITEVTCRDSWERWPRMLKAANYWLENLHCSAKPKMGLEVLDPRDPSK